MIRALWFLVKLGALAAAVLWVAERPGEISGTWLGYTFTIDIGLFFGILLVVILAAIFIYSLMRTVAGLPAGYRTYRSARDREKGYKVLTAGLAAVAAGDTKAAVRDANRAAQLLAGENNGLSLLLEAQAARMEGRNEEARRKFTALLENKEGSFLGIRGLLHESLARQDYEGAQALLERALKLHPKQGWILRTAYDVHIRKRDWDGARTLLKRAVKYGAIEKQKAESDRVAILLAEAEEASNAGQQKPALQKAVKAAGMAPDFVPASLLAAEFYLRNKNRRGAVAAISKIWRRNPHPALADAWMDLAPVKKSGKSKSLGSMDWMEKLVVMNPDSADSHLAAGKRALDYGLWGEARLYLERAESLRPDARVYEALALLEERGAHNQAAADLWREKAETAPAGPVWLCRRTGRIYERWSPVAQPHGSFNTIEWGWPEKARDRFNIDELEGGEQDFDPPLYKDASF